MGVFAKRLDGREEPILDPGIVILDAHMHLFERSDLRYMPEDYQNDAAAGHNVVGSVYVETGAFALPDGPALLRPSGEVAFVNEVAAASAAAATGCRLGAAIVGHADLTAGDAIVDLLDLSLEIAPDRYRGVRQLLIDHPSPSPFEGMLWRPPAGLLDAPGFRDGFGHLASRGLSFDAGVFDVQLPDIAELASTFPNTVIVLDHLGGMMGLDVDGEGRKALFGRWREMLRDLARRPNVFCKISGLGMRPWGFGLESRPYQLGFAELASIWRPYVETAIEAFGADRCMMASNYPPDGRTCGFVPLWNALKHAVSDLSRDEKAALFHGTAARVYRIALPAIGT